MKISAIVKIRDDEVEVNFVEPHSSEYVVAKMQASMLSGSLNFSNLADAFRMAANAMVLHQNYMACSSMSNVD